VVNPKFLKDKYVSDGSDMPLTLPIALIFQKISQVKSDVWYVQ